MKTTTLLVFTVLLISLKVNAQKSQGYIIINDTVSTKGIDLSFNELNPREVRSVFANKTFLSYSADDIVEFGFGDKTRFVSKKVLYNNKLQNVFLELLADGEVRFLRLGRGKNSQLFLENDTLIELKKENYQATLSLYTKACEKWAQQVEQINYSVPSIRYVIQELNARNCENLPFLSYGLFGGYNSSQITIENRFINPISVGDFDINSSGITAGVFIEKPVWRSKHISIAGNFSYNYNNFQGSQSENKTAIGGPGGSGVVPFFYEVTTNIQRKINVKTSYVTLDISPKYTFQASRFQFYFSVGLSAGRPISFVDELLTVTTVSFPPETTTDFNPDFIPSDKLLFGHTYATGIQFAYRYGRYISLEFKRLEVGNSDVFTITNNIISLKFNL